MTDFQTNLNFPRQVFQGDNFDFELTVNSNLAGYKCRVYLFDEDDNSVQLATANVTGGADTQVLITGGVTSTIKVYVPKDKTDDFKEASYLEVEIEDTNAKVYTILVEKFKMLPENLTWTEPS